MRGISDESNGIRNGVCYRGSGIVCEDLGDMFYNSAPFSFLQHGSNFSKLKDKFVIAGLGLILAADKFHLPAVIA